MLCPKTHTHPLSDHSSMVRPWSDLPLCLTCVTYLCSSPVIRASGSSVRVHVPLYVTLVLVRYHRDKMDGDEMQKSTCSMATVAQFHFEENPINQLTITRTGCSTHYRAFDKISELELRIDLTVRGTNSGHITDAPEGASGEIPF